MECGRSSKDRSSIATSWGNFVEDWLKADLENNLLDRPGITPWGRFRGPPLQV
jgi:hypothetical protein